MIPSHIPFVKIKNTENERRTAGDGGRRFPREGEGRAETRIRINSTLLK